MKENSFLKKTFKLHFVEDDMRMVERKELVKYCECNSRLDTKRLDLNLRDLWNDMQQSAENLGFAIIQLVVVLETGENGGLQGSL